MIKNQPELFAQADIPVVLGPGRSCSPTNVNKLVRDEVVSKFKERRVETVLDVGCGIYASDSAHLANQGFSVEAYDVDPRVAKIPRRNFKIHTTYPETTHDGALCHFVLNTIESSADRESLLETIAEHLVPHGLLSVTVRNIRNIEREKKPTWQKHGDGYLVKRQFQRGYNREQLHHLLKKKGFDVLLYQNACSALGAIAQLRPREYEQPELRLQ